MKVWKGWTIQCIRAAKVFTQIPHYMYTAFPMHLRLLVMPVCFYEMTFLMFHKYKASHSTCLSVPSILHLIWCLWIICMHTWIYVYVYMFDASHDPHFHSVLYSIVIAYHILYPFVSWQLPKMLTFLSHC